MHPAVCMIEMIRVVHLTISDDYINCNLKAILKDYNQPFIKKKFLYG